MASDDYVPRPDDHRVEPFLAGLEVQPGKGVGAEEEADSIAPVVEPGEMSPRPRRGLRALWRGLLERVGLGD